QDRIQSEGRSRQDDADSRCGAPITPRRPPNPTLPARQGADPRGRDRSRVEAPVIVSERDHSRRVPSLAAHGPTGPAGPSGQAVDRIRVDRGRTEDRNHGNPSRVSAAPPAPPPPPPPLSAAPPPPAPPPPPVRVLISLP